MSTANAWPSKPLRVGVSLHVREGFQSIWENGIFQNVVFLVQLLQNSPLVGQAVVVTDRAEPVVPHEAMQFSGLGIEFMTMADAAQNLDVMVEMSAQFSEDWVAAFRARGGRYVWMRVGNDYVIDIERAMFNLPHAGLCSRKAYDAVWTLPEYENSCQDYFALTARAPVTLVPHLWTPQFFDRGIAQLPAGEHFGYQSGRERWRLCSFEPNVCMVKTGLIPMLIAEEAYRARPEAIEQVRMCNTLKQREHDGFVRMAQRLDIVRHGVATFEGRFAVYEVMARHGDAVLSHHWENGQNYLYYEALYGGYPLVHNSLFIRDLGYYYPEFDCQAGGRAVLQARDEHDANLPGYRASAQAFLHTLAIDHPANVQAYGQALQALYV